MIGERIDVDCAISVTSSLGPSNERLLSVKHYEYTDHGDALVRPATSL
jgi:hypothetical protein